MSVQSSLINSHVNSVPLSVRIFFIGPYFKMNSSKMALATDLAVVSVDVAHTKYLVRSHIIVMTYNLPFVAANGPIKSIMSESNGIFGVSVKINSSFVYCACLFS